MREEQLICINCPAGCRLTAEQSHDGEWQVTGNRCARGTVYAKQELTDPRRVLTCLMRVSGRGKPISVKTDRPVPKAMLLDCARAIYREEAKLPVFPGDVLIRDLLGTGCNVVATRGMK